MMRRIAHLPARVARLLVLGLLVVLPGLVRGAATPVVLDGLAVEALNERSTLDRATRILTSSADITVTNTLGRVIGGPVHAIVRLSADGVQVPGALGAPGAPPYDAYYFDLSSQLAGGSWAPGAGLHFPLTLTRPSTVRVQYTLEFRGVLAVNQPPVARAGEDQIVRLAAGESQRTVTLDATGSSDADGTVTQYLWSGTPTPANVARPELLLGAGDYVFALRVLDNEGLAGTTDTVSVRVLAADAVEPPGIVADPPQVTVEAGQTARIAVTGNGPENDFITLSATPRIGTATFATQPGAPARGQFALPTTAGQSGRYVVRFTARNLAGLTSQTTAEVIVQRKNHPPLLSVQPSAQVAEGGLLTVAVQASDPDGDAVSIAADGLPDNAAYIEASRSLNFAPDFTQAGQYAVTFTASDGEDAGAAQTLLIEVANVEPGSGPTSGSLTLAVDPLPPYTFAQGQHVTGRVNGGDAHAEPQPLGSGLITHLSPTSGEQNLTLDVELSGPASGPFAVAFVAGQSSADFGAGVTVESLQVQSPTEAQARIRIAADAAPGPRGVRVSTAGATAISTLAFSVVPGKTVLRGQVIDPETGLPLAGARVSVQGTNLFAVTDAQGNFVLHDVPPGTLTLIVNAPNHELMLLEVEVQAGQATDLGALSSPSTVFDPNAPPSASLPSVVGRGLGLNSGGMKMEDARRLITDVMLLVGGSEAGVLDEFGNQLNPLVEGAGKISLMPEGVRMMAQRMQRGGETLSLGEILYAFSHGLQWSGGHPLTLAEWLAGLQAQVNRAWSDPGQSDNAMVVAIFNQGGVLLPDPPQVTAEMRLGPVQAFLLTSSLWAFIADPRAEVALAPPPARPAGWWGDVQAAGRLLGRGLALLEQEARADDTASSPKPAPYTRYWRSFFAGQGGLSNYPTMQVASAFRTQLMFTSAMTMPGLSVLDMTMRGAVAATTAGVVHDMVTSAFKLAALANQVPEPPQIQEATVTNEGGSVQVHVKFRRSPSHTRDVNIVYLLWRFRVPDEPRELVGSFQATREFNQTFTEEQFNRLYSSFTLHDTSPLPETFDPFGNVVKAPSATWYYALTATRLQSMEGELDADAFERTIPWWSLPNAGVLPSLGPFVYRTQQMLVSDYSRPAVVTVNSDGIVARADEVEVDPRTNDAYLGIGSGDPQAADYDRPRIIKFGTTDTQPRVFAFHDFKAPGPKGLAIDRNGTLYSENSSSDALYGGRLFGFAQPGGVRSFVGSLNYFSQMLMFANPVAGGPMDIGPGGVTTQSPEDLYVVDELVRQVKRAPVQAPYDPYRRVAQPWATIPYITTSLDLEVEETSGNGALLVERLGSAGLTLQLVVSHTFRRPGDPLTLTATVSNPSVAAVQNVRLDTPRLVGEGTLFLEEEPTSQGLTLAPGASQTFVYHYVGGRPGFVQLVTVARGSASNVTVTSPEVSSLSVEVGSALVVSKITPEAPTIAPGREFMVEIEYFNRGETPLQAVVPTCEWTAPLLLNGAQVGEALRLSNPNPATIATLPAGQRATCSVRFLAVGMGKVAFRAGGDAIDGANGDPVPAVPRIDGPVNISPVEVLIEAPTGVRLDADFNVVAKVRNLATEALENVTVDLPITGGEGKAEIRQRPPAGAVTIAGGQTQAFTFQLHSLDTPTVVMHAAAAMRYEGEAIAAESPEARIAIGPTVHGRLLDVVFDLPLQLMSDNSPGKSLGTKIVDDKVGLAGRTIRATGGPSVVEATTDDEGNFTLPLDGPGYYYIEVLDTTTNIGYRRRILVEDKPYALDINLPLSLYRSARDLIFALESMTLKVGDPEAVLNPFPPYDSIPLLTFKYDAFTSRAPFYLKRFAQGYQSPIYEGVYRGSGREPNDWDALTRLCMMMAFSKRRFEEIKVPSFLVVRGLTLWVLTLPAVSKNVWGGLDNYFQGGLAARFPRLAASSNPVAVKYKRVVAIMIGFVATQVINRSGVIDSPQLRAYYDRLAVLYFKLVRFLPAFAGKALAGDLVFEAVFQTANTFGTQFLLQDLYINALTEPILLDALQRAETVQIAGDTKDLVLEVSLMDERIMPQMYIKTAAFKTLHTDIAVLRGANGLQELRTAAYSPRGDPNAAKVFKQVGAIKRITGLVLSGSSVLATLDIFGLHPGQTALALKALFDGDARAANADIVQQLIANLAYPLLDVTLTTDEQGATP